MDLSKAWFISDFHFGHAGIMKTFHRPFNDVMDMKTKLMDNVFNTVPVGDTLFFLGDWGNDLSPLFPMVEKYDFHFIFGNHDRENYDPDTLRNDIFKVIKKYPKIYEYPIMINGLWLSHEPIGVMLRECPYLNIHGHTHSLNYGNGGKWIDGNRYFNVSVEMIDYTPISFAEIGKRIKYSM